MTKRLLPIVAVSALVWFLAHISATSDRALACPTDAVLIDGRPHLCLYAVENEARCYMLLCQM